MPHYIEMPLHLLGKDNFHIFSVNLDAIVYKILFPLPFLNVQYY